MQTITTRKNNIFALLYGQSGSGKTWLASSLGELGNVLIVDSDQGYMTLLQSALQKYSDNITIVSCDKFSNINTIYECCSKNDKSTWDNAISGLDSPIGGYQWVVFDTWTEMQWLITQEIREQFDVSFVRRNKQSTKDLSMFRAPFEIAEWGQLNDFNKLCIEKFRECNLNFLFICQEGYTQDNTTSEITHGVALSGKLVKEFPGYFDVVIHQFIDVQNTRVSTTKSTNKFYAKTRFGIGSDWKNATMKTILQL